MKKLLHLFAVTMTIIPMLASAHGPTRQMVEEKIIINAPVDKVWAMVKDFSAIDQWHPAVKSVAMKDDKTRTLTLKADGEPTITEELDKVDDEKMMLIYTIEDMSVVKTITFNSKDTPYYTLPVSTYKSWIYVKEVDKGTEVKWRGKFYRSFMDNPPVPEGQSDSDAVDVITDVYKSGLENLKNVLEK
ncbi:MxaD gene product [Methylophaga frappieri]|uniref:MxaD gene product n=1 Tax=Methylophaga frappieri (strain ATCC BAA-2434 / DSM 25690 / JAM7) TaxID=754477 RepID=I1YIQ2_METFJ|nr:SRPBCC family protein [Methylophaga frappieri]AFJ02795.1 MxaD gene product [Methylophaga frappieri]